MVKKVTAKNFTNSGNLKNVNKHGMLLIYADWCGHCRRFTPEYEDIDRLTGNDYLCLKIQDIDLTPELSKKLNVMGFPTIKFFDKNGVIIGDFNGERTTDNILGHICKTYHYCINNNR